MSRSLIDNQYFVLHFTTFPLDKETMLRIYIIKLRFLNYNYYKS